MKIFSLILFGYGVGLEYRKEDKNYNPKKPNCQNDGTIHSFDFDKYISKYTNWCFTFGFLYNYTLILRVYLNKEI